MPPSRHYQGLFVNENAQNAAAQRGASVAAGRAWIRCRNGILPKPENSLKNAQNPKHPLHAVLGGFEPAKTITGRNHANIQSLLWKLVNILLTRLG